MKKYFIKIIKANPVMWYSKHIGEVFEVETPNIFSGGYVIGLTKAEFKRVMRYTQYTSQFEFKGFNIEFGDFEVIKETE